MPASSGTLAGNMVTGTVYTGGADSDPLLDNLSTPLVYANSSTNATAGTNPDRVTYTLSLPSSGTWYLWGRFYYAGAPGSNDANSFFVTVDSGTPRKFGNNLDFFRKWHWDGNGNTETGALDAIALNLSGGAHTIAVARREVVANPPRLDMICLSQSATPPTDAEACLVAPNGTCAGATTTTSTSTTTTTSTTTSTSTTVTLPPLPEDLVCVKAGSDPTAVFNGAMTTGTQYTGGADLDALRDNMTSPLVFANSSTSSKVENTDRVSYVVNVPSTDTWYLWGRFYYPGAPGSNDPNSFSRQARRRRAREVRQQQGLLPPVALGRRRRRGDRRSRRGAARHRDGGQPHADDLQA